MAKRKIPDRLKGIDSFSPRVNLVLKFILGISAIVVIVSFAGWQINNQRDKAVQEEENYIQLLQTDIQNISSFESILPSTVTKIESYIIGSEKEAPEYEAGYRPHLISGENRTAVNYYSVEDHDLYYRLVYKTEDGQVGSRNVLYSDEVDVWMSYDKLQEEYAESVDSGIENKNIYSIITDRRRSLTQ